MALDQATFDRLRGLWVSAGGDPGRADVAAAIAFAESEGCPYALAGPKDIRPVKECVWRRTSGENSCGYWQINLDAHPGYKAPAIFNELENAKAAVTISENGRSFAPWSTYTDRAYEPFLAQYGAGGADAGGSSGGVDLLAADATLAQGTWASGWKHLSGSLARELPKSLAASHNLRHDALHRLRRAHKVR